VEIPFYKFFGAALTEARFDAGRVTDALALVDRAFNTGEGPASGLYVSEVHRLRGTFLKSLGSPAEEVESALRTALKIAEEQGAFLLKLRAVTSATRARCSKLANCLLRFTGGSLRGSTRAI
jgi:hypothetical protein